MSTTDPRVAEAIQLARHYDIATLEVYLTGAFANLDADLADERAEVERLSCELKDRLQKQRAAEAELAEVRKDGERLTYLLDEVSMRALCDAGVIDDTREAIDIAMATAMNQGKP